MTQRGRREDNRDVMILTLIKERDEARGHRKQWRRHAFMLWDVVRDVQEKLAANRVSDAMAALDNAASWMEPKEESPDVPGKSK